MLIDLLFLTPALGQDVAPELNTQHFRPTVDGARTLWTDDSERLPEGHFRAALHYADDVLVYEAEDGSSQDLLSSVLQADLMGAVALDRLRLGLVFPVLLTSASEVYPDEGGLGDVSLDAKLSLLDRRIAPLGLAAQGRLSLPTSTLAEMPLANPNPGWELSAVLDKELGDWLIAANLGVRGGNQVELGNVTLNDALSFRSALGYALGPDTGASLELAGRLPLSAEATNPAGAPMEWLLGGYRHLGSGLVARFGGGTGLTNGIASPDLRLVAAVGYDPSFDRIPDRDGDGLTDADDLCPDEAEDLDRILDEDGCPDPDPVVQVVVLDVGGEPIPGARLSLRSPGGDDVTGGPGDLQRTLRPGDHTLRVTAEGFQPTEAPLSLDGSEADPVTVTVALEPAPGVLQITVLDPGGSPLAASLTVDGVALDGTTFRGEPGPHEVQASAEGFTSVRRAIELSPGSEEALTLRLSPGRVTLIEDRIEITESIFFDTNTATLQADSLSIIDEIASLLLDHPELARLRIEGHTDSRGDAGYNRRLSGERAGAVLTALVERGVAPDRLTAVGHGEDRLEDPADTEAAHERNRRVDFFVEARSE